MYRLSCFYSAVRVVTLILSRNLLLSPTSQCIHIYRSRQAQCARNSCRHLIIYSAVVSCLVLSWSDYHNIFTLLYLRLQRKTSVSGTAHVKSRKQNPLIIEDPEFTLITHVFYPNCLVLPISAVMAIGRIYLKLAYMAWLQKSRDLQIL